MIRIIIFAVLFLGSSGYSWAYDAILSPFTKNSFHIAYESNEKSNISLEINNNLGKINISEQAKFTEYSTATLNEIDNSRQFIADILATVKYTLTINGILENASKELSKEVLLALSATVLDETNKALSSMGVKPSQTGLEVLVNAIVNAFVVAAKDKVSGSDMVGIVLDSIGVINDIAAIIKVNKNLFYSLSTTIESAYTKYYVDYLIKSSYYGSENQRGKYLVFLSLEEFLKNRYMYGHEIVDMTTFLDRTRGTPISENLYGYSLYNSIFNSDNTIDPDEYNTLTDYVLDSPRLLVGGMVDLYTELYSQTVGFDNLLKYMERGVEKRLYMLDLIEPLFVLHFGSDNYESAVSGGLTKYGHSVSDLTSFTMYPIGKRREVNEFSAIQVCEDNSFQHVPLKSNMRDTFSQAIVKRRCGKLGAASLNINIQGFSYSLIDSFYLQDRYTTIPFGSFLYRNLTQLKLNGINFNDSSELDWSRNIEREEFSRLLSSLYDYLYKATGQYVDPNDLFINMPSGNLTHSDILKTIDSLFTKFYGNEYYKYNGKTIYPSYRSKSLLMSILRYRSGVNDEYIKNLSRSGIIKLDIRTIDSKLHSNINLYYLVKYISRVVGYKEFRGGK
mgnify:CR=1 FL=1